MAVVRRKALGLRTDGSDVSSADFELARERRIQAGLARRSAKKELVTAQTIQPDHSHSSRPPSRGGLARPGSSGLVASGSEALLGGLRKSPTEGAAAVVGGKAPRRRWTVDLSCEQDDEVPSPKWAKPVVRKAANRLVVDEKGYDDAPPQIGEDQGFPDTARKLHGLVQQATLRILNFFTKIREEHRQQPAKMQEEANLQRLSEVSYLIAVTNYKFSKWLFQLSPATYVKPNKPELSAEEHRTPDELFREIQFTLSRTEVLASDLIPKLQKIMGDAKAVATNPRYAKMENADEPISPGSSNPVRLAQKRGIRDVKEMHGAGLHLERLLEVAQSLAHRPAGASAVKVTTTVIMAAARFKRCLARRRERTNAGSADRIARLLQG